MLTVIIIAVFNICFKQVTFVFYEILSMNSVYIHKSWNQFTTI